MGTQARRPRATTRISGRRLVAEIASALLLVLVIGATPSFAHGPTIEITHSEMKPALLNLFVGSTVHFLNTVAMPGGHVVVDESGKIESPPLAEPGDDWHYTFEEVGTYELFIKQHPKNRAKVVIVEKPGS
jgi:plastocyanin